jgi:hypothetical protein
MEQRAHTQSDGLQIDLYNDKSLDRSPGVNWVEARGGLPPNVRARARAIKRKNPSWSLSRCIATAINANKYSESADDTFFPGPQRQRRHKRAGHIKANRQWEALKGRKNMAEETGDAINLRNFPAAARKKAAKKGQAVKDPKASGGGSYPIKNAEDAKNAEKLFKAKKGKYDPKKKRKIAAHIKRQANKVGAGVNMSNVDLAKQQNGKEGAASDGNRNAGSLAKTIAAYKKKKGKMSSSQRKKVEARIKSSQQQLGQKVGLSEAPSATVDLAANSNSLTKRPSSLGQSGKTASQPRQYGGKFGNKAGSGPKGSSGTSGGSASTTQIEPVTPQQISAAVGKLAIGQAITLPGGNGKVKRLSTGYQVVKMDGSFNKVFIAQSQAVMAASRLIGGRRAKDTELKKTGGSTLAGKAQT